MCAPKMAIILVQHCMLITFEIHQHRIIKKLSKLITRNLK